MREKIVLPILAGLFVAYIIIGVLYALGLGDEKTIMVTSIVAMMIALSQVVTLFVSAVNASRSKTIMASLCILQEWLQQNELTATEIKSEKIKDFNTNNKIINKEYDRKVRTLEIINCSIIVLGVIVFVVLISFRQIPGNAKMADSISLISFALLFGTKAFEMANNRYSDDCEKRIGKILEDLEIPDEG